ncbi:MAG: enoyl-CoA hydratase/isomerase family protein [Burkholderiales bacterium]
MTMLTERIEGSVLTLELARVDRGNALNRSLQAELAEAWERFENDERLRVAVLQGAPDVFSIGHDVAELAADTGLSPIADAGMHPLHLSRPVIAAIEGPCYGLGFELALACDLRVAAEGASFGFADPHLFVPYRVASVLLPRMTFLGDSLELILSGRILAAAEMRAIGLVSELTPKGRASARASELAHDMVQRFGRGDFRKQAIWRLSGMPLPAAMQTARSPR